MATDVRIKNVFVIIGQREDITLAIGGTHGDVNSGQNWTKDPGPGGNR